MIRVSVTRPAVLYHATTPKKLARYHASHDRILPPVRGFDCEEAAREWGRLAGRTVFCRVFVEPQRTHKLPDHHNEYGEAYWHDAPSAFEVLP